MPWVWPAVVPRSAIAEKSSSFSRAEGRPQTHSEAQPDRGFRRLNLAEERTNRTELMMTPMLKKPGRLRRDLPLAGIRQGAPDVYVAADLIDDRRGIVLLF